MMIKDKKYYKEFQEDDDQIQEILILKSKEESVPLSKDKSSFDMMKDKKIF